MLDIDKFRLVFPEIMTAELERQKLISEANECFKKSNELRDEAINLQRQIKMLIVKQYRNKQNTIENIKSYPSSITPIHIEPEKKQFWEEEVPYLNNLQFKKKFRVSRKVFNDLVKYCKKSQFEFSHIKKEVSLEKKIGIALYALGSTDEYRTIGELFGVLQSKVETLCVQFSRIVIKHCQDIAINGYPPTEAKIKENINGFKENWGFPQVYGAVDGCHIQVVPPRGKTNYCNQKGWNSMVLLAVVDYKYRFIYINVGSPGGNNDSYILERSILKKHHENNELFKKQSNIICGVKIPVLLLGDSAFRLTNYLMKPYMYSKNRNENEKNFNHIFSRTRSVSEKTFAYLKARFRRLDKSLKVQEDNVHVIISACCIIHNMCLEANDEVLDEWLIVLNQTIHKPQPRIFNSDDDDIDSPAMEIRDALCNFFAEPV